MSFVLKLSQQILWQAARESCGFLNFSNMSVKMEGIPYIWGWRLITRRGGIPSFSRC